MRDPEALQVGPGAVARLRSPILIKTPISLPFPGSGVSYLPPEGGWTSFRVRPIVRDSAAADAVPSPNEGPGSAAGRAGCGGATPEPDFYIDPNSISISRLRSLLPSARRRMDELPGPSHRTRLREGTGKPDQRERLRRGGRGAEPDVLANAVRGLCFIKTIPLPFPGSGVSYLPPEGGWTSFRVRPIVRELPSPSVQERDL